MRNVRRFVDFKELELVAFYHFFECGLSIIEHHCHINGATFQGLSNDKRLLEAMQIAHNFRAKEDE